MATQYLGQLGYKKKITNSMKKLRNRKLMNGINKFIVFPKGEHGEFAKQTVGFTNFRVYECKITYRHSGHFLMQHC